MQLSKILCSSHLHYIRHMNSSTFELGLQFSIIYSYFDIKKHFPSVNYYKKYTLQRKLGN